VILLKTISASKEIVLSAALYLMLSIRPKVPQHVLASLAINGVPLDAFVIHLKIISPTMEAVSSAALYPTQPSLLQVLLLVLALLAILGVPVVSVDVIVTQLRITPF